MSDRPTSDSAENMTLPDESEFVRGANAAIRRAIDSAHRQGIATTHERDGRLVLVSPDGQEQELGPLVRR